MIGKTNTGKTLLSKHIARGLKSEGYGILVLDGMGDKEWLEVADFYTTDAAEFRMIAERSSNCFLFIDEAGMFCKLHDEENYWFATQARHWGHSSFFISQRGVQIAPTVRYQCTRLFLFSCSKTDAKVLADEFGEDELLNATRLEKLEFYRAGNFIECSRHNLLDMI